MNVVALRKSRNYPLIALAVIAVGWAIVLASSRTLEVTVGTLISAAWAAGFGYLAIFLLRKAKSPRITFLVAAVLCGIFAFLYTQGFYNWWASLPEDEQATPVVLSPEFPIWAVFELLAMWLVELVVYTIVSNRGKTKASKTAAKIFGVICLVLAGNAIFWMTEAKIECSINGSTGWCGFAQAIIAVFSAYALVPFGITYLILKLVAAKKSKLRNDSANL